MTVTDASTERVKPPSALSHTDRRAKQSALIVRALIIGQDTDEGGVAPPQVPISSAQLKNVKAQLLKPKTADKGHCVAQSSACVPQLCFTRK